jgi:peptidoglycan/LPS O-acetylase OafA/YrhL
MAAFEEQRSDRKTSFLNGYRTQYTMISVVGHLYMPIIAGARASYVYLLEEYINQTGKGNFYHFVFNLSCFAVTFNFVISGCLAVITLFSQFDKMKASGRTFSLSDSVKIILIRALRTLPVVGFVILLTLSLPSTLPFNLTGPLTPSVFKNMTDICMNHGWKEMTFTANILQAHHLDICLPVAWFISADMQIFVVSLFIIVALYYKRIIGLFLVVLQIILGVVLTWRQNSQLRPPTFIVHDDLYNSQQLFFDVNLQTVTHITSYAIGILLGLAIYRGKQRNGAQPGLSRGFVKSIIGFASMFVISGLKIYLYDTSGVFKIDSYTTEMALSSTLRLLLSCGFAAIIYGLFLEPESGYAKFWYKPYHRIIARLSFSIFMTHIFIIAVVHGHARQPDLDFTDTVWQLKSVLVLVTSLVPGFIMFVLVEVPSINIIKSLIQGPKRKGHAVGETTNNGTVTKDKKGKKELQVDTEQV